MFVNRLNGIERFLNNSLRNVNFTQISRISFNKQLRSCSSLLTSNRFTRRVLRNVLTVFPTSSQWDTRTQISKAGSPSSLRLEWTFNSRLIQEKRKLDRVFTNGLSGKSVRLTSRLRPVGVRYTLSKSSGIENNEGNDKNAADPGELRNRSKNRSKKRGSPPTINIDPILLSLFIIGVSLAVLTNGLPGQKEISFQEFLENYVASGLVEKITVINNEVVCPKLYDYDVLSSPSLTQSSAVSQSSASLSSTLLSSKHLASYSNVINTITNHLKRRIPVWLRDVISDMQMLLNRNHLGEESQEMPTEMLPMRPRTQVYFRIGSVERFEEKVDEYCRKYMERLKLDLPTDNYADASDGPKALFNIPIFHEKKFRWASELKNYAGFFFLLIGASLIMNRLAMADRGEHAMQMLKAKPQTYQDTKSLVKFTDIAGMSEAKAEVREFIDFLRDPKKYTDLGATVPKGALMIGAPGTGKTLLAKAVAGEANVPFYSMSGSDFIEVFVGVGPARVRDLFNQARENAPSIVFVDELDAIGRRRGRGGFSQLSNDERENTLNQILVEMDGFYSGSGVIVLAGTNRGDVLDPALLRPGRFDRLINIDLPEIHDREQIFELYLTPLKLCDSVSLDKLAKHLAALTPGFAGADIKNLCNEAAIFAARKGNKDGIKLEDFNDSIDRIIYGSKSSRVLKSDVKKIVAFHEAGHGITGWMLPFTDPITKMTIIPRGKGLGATQYLPADTPIVSKNALLNRMAVLLGGRASEEIYTKTFSTGASDDLDKATKLAYSMITRFGMYPDEFGMLTYPTEDDSTNGNLRFYKPFSEKTGRAIDELAKRIVEDQYQRVVALLKENEQTVIKLANELHQRESLSMEEIEACIGVRQESPDFPVRIDETISECVSQSNPLESETLRLTSLVGQNIILRDYISQKTQAPERSTEL